ncbi:Putative inosine-uridine preferring nucleoside hydrolase [Sodalis praecaptivus]|uniref:Putative inosine-uridine preferring nucleoside hydrolase n=1 Tax=Sodalis praecaptivus TaxID=1239307 RepID=W0HZ15_9GAMM|nr:nucleoside hydrolase [Sodalis praecaptivus]AHF77403.1 Putative inosine-uridine preferring nucleoside hydrolase [Sodalis praecaptivus]
MIKAIYDTDPGVDDAVALHFAAENPAITLVGITTVFGNNTLDVTTRNALFLKEKLDIACPVARGAATPLIIAPNPPSVVAHGNDGLGDVFDIAPRGELDPRPAAQFIIDTVRANPGDITLIAVGPLTNLALACRLDPAIVPLVKSVVIMGGTTLRNAHFGNKSPVAEANIHRDPHAAQIVFNSGLPLTMVGLDVTHEVLLDNARLRRLEQHANPHNQLLHRIIGHYIAYAKARYGLDGMRPHDLQAFVCAIHPEYYQTVEGNVQVVMTGPAEGQTLHYFGEHLKGREHLSMTQVCVAVDAQRVADCYFDTLLK